MQNYFSLFELSGSFDLDLSHLEKAYFAAQRRFHPDRLIGKSAQEREAAIRQSMLINEAYESLKNPLKHAQHLLTLAGTAMDSVKPSQELLMDIMELREALSDSKDIEDIERLGKENTRAQAKVLDGLLQAFNDSDINKAAQLTNRLSYLTKIEAEIGMRRKMPA